MPLFVQDTQDIYEADVDQLIHFIRGDHVLSGCGVTAQAAPNMTVQIAAGVLRYQGALVTVAAVASLAVSGNASGNPRVDLVSVDNTGVIVITQGTPAAITATSGPKPPSLPANSVVLAFVSVANGAVNIQNSNITDRRLITPTDSIIAGTLATRPAAAAGTKGLFYFATDDNGGTLYRDNGGSWVVVAAYGTGLKYLDLGDKAAVAITVDWTQASTQRFRMTGNPSSLAFTAPPAPAWLGLIVEQDGTGGRVLPADPGTVKYANGAARPAPTTTASKKDIYTYWYDGTNYHATVLQAY